MISNLNTGHYRAISTQTMNKSCVKRKIWGGTLPLPNKRLDLYIELALNLFPEGLFTLKLYGMTHQQIGFIFT
ncbi:hypothetical protein [Mariniflexile ostreae]|uniref:hypothetical protein n=1 Tax=Mariniflexile ostreae TaxID=1520892 RepID=UPI00406BC416